MGRKRKATNDSAGPHTHFIPAFLRLGPEVEERQGTVDEAGDFHGLFTFQSYRNVNESTTFPHRVTFDPRIDFFDCCLLKDLPDKSGATNKTAEGTKFGRIELRGHLGMMAYPNARPGPFEDYRSVSLAARIAGHTFCGLIGCCYLGGVVGTPEITHTRWVVPVRIDAATAEKLGGTAGEQTLIVNTPSLTVELFGKRYETTIVWRPD